MSQCPFSPSQYVQLSEIFYILTTTFLKISLGLFFLRLLTKPWQVRLFQIILATSAVYGLFYFFATVFVCGSPTRIQDAFLNPKTCSPTWFILSTGYIYGVINVIADWTFTLIPIIILLDSDMDRQSKISVSIVMGFAAIGSVSSILRMVYLEGLLFGHSVSSTSKPRASFVLQILILLQSLRSKPLSGPPPSPALASSPPRPPSYGRSSASSLPTSVAKSLNTAPADRQGPTRPARIRRAQTARA